ncbi:MAG: hypothetical protein AB7S77_22070 [Desulfatirhabdiaceae bacterium]
MAKNWKTVFMFLSITLLIIPMCPQGVILDRLLMAAPAPDTGQAKRYNSTGNKITCPSNVSLTKSGKTSVPGLFSFTSDNNPVLQAMITHNWISLNSFPANTGVNVKINEGTRGDFTITTDSNGNFFAVGENWPGQSLVRGDRIQATFGSQTVSMVVQNLTAEVNIAENTIAGQAFSLPDNVPLANRKVIVDIRDQFNPESQRFYFGETLVQPDGAFVFNGLSTSGYTLQRGHAIFMTLFGTADGASTGHTTSIEPYNGIPRLDVSPDQNWISGNGFPFDSALTLTIDPISSNINLNANLTSDFRGNFNKNVYEFNNPDNQNEPYQLQPGDKITILYGIDQNISFTVPDASIAVDTTTDTISGTAPGYQTVRIVVYGPDGSVLCDNPVTVDENGNFSTRCPGLKPGMDIDLLMTDADGNTCWYHGNNPRPNFAARMKENEVHGYQWPLGAAVILTIDDPATGSAIDYQDTRTVVTADWDPSRTFVNFPLNNFPLKAGHIVSLTHDSFTKTHTVTRLVVTGVDPDADTVSGTADPGSTIEVGHLCDNTGCTIRRVNADQSGNWRADFSQPGNDPDEQQLFDITAGTGSEARQIDDDEDFTQYGWTLPRLQAMITHNWINGDGFPPDTEGTLSVNGVTITIYGDPEGTIVGRTGIDGSFYANGGSLPNGGIAVGDVIDVVVGNVQAGMTIQNLQSTADAINNRIAGSAKTPSGKVLGNHLVEVSINPEWGQNSIHSQQTRVDEYGNFVLDLGGFDLLTGHKIFLTVYDDPDGNAQGHRTSMSPFNDPKTIYVSVTNNNYPDGRFRTLYDISLWQDPNIVIDEIYIEGPTGTLPYTKDDFHVWASDPYYRWLFVDGQPALGTYTFHVVSNGIDVTEQNVQAAQDVQTVNRTMPISGFVTPQNGARLTTTTPTIEWTPVSHPDTPIYYRLVIDDMNDNRIFSTPRAENLLSITVPEGYLKPGGSYLLQVRTSDSGDWKAMQNQGRSFCTISIATSSKGDLNADGHIDLADGIMALQILAGYPVVDVSLDADVNGDGRIGMPEAIYVLQKVAGF